MRCNPGSDILLCNELPPRCACMQDPENAQPSYDSLIDIRSALHLAYLSWEIGDLRERGAL